MLHISVAAATRSLTPNRKYKCSMSARSTTIHTFLSFSFSPHLYACPRNCARASLFLLLVLRRSSVARVALHVQTSITCVRGCVYVVSRKLPLASGRTKQRYQIKSGTYNACVFSRSFFLLSVLIRVLKLEWQTTHPAIPLYSNFFLNEILFKYLRYFS